LAVSRVEDSTPRVDDQTDRGHGHGWRRVIARAAWSATRAARDVRMASAASAPPRGLINQAFDLPEHDCGRRTRPGGVDLGDVFPRLRG
jgi:hypothetical protein